MIKIKKAKSSEVFLISSHIFTDERGIYSKNYEKQLLDRYFKFNIDESSLIYANKNSLRGLHIQLDDFQAKYIQVIKGKIFDVIVDLRIGESSFGSHETFILDDKNMQSLFIPKGFAHGFLALEDTIFSYHSEGIYRPEKSSGIVWNDNSLNINWPIKSIDRLIVSEKDKNLHEFKAFTKLLKSNQQLET